MSSPPTEGQSSVAARLKSEQGAFNLCVAVLTLLCLWPLWSVRFPPLQDYPQHIVQSAMLATQGDPGIDFTEAFELGLEPGPYAIFFAVSGACSKLASFEVAGKVALSLYVLLITFLVLRSSRGREDSGPSWGLLLLFPFAFHQQYFQGFVSYLHALPLLVLALDAHRDLMRARATTRTTLGVLLFTLALFFAHPFAFVVFLGYVPLQVFLAWKRAESFRPGLVAFALALFVFGSWMISSGAVGGGAFRWSLSLSRTWAGFACMFTGMRWVDGIEWSTLVLWVLLLACCVGAAVLSGEARQVLRSRHALLFALTTLGVFIAPFSKGSYTFISLRLAPIAFFFLAMAIGHVRFKGAWRVALVVLVGALTLQSVQKQAVLSAETAEILPLLQRMEPDAFVLPLVFDNDSPELDRWLFDPHLHDHDYYHLLVGGGFNPYFLKALIHPVQVKPEMSARAPAPGEYRPGLFRYELHAGEYRYFLVRAAPPGLSDYMGHFTERVVDSGAWTLYERRPGF